MKLQSPFLNGCLRGCISSFTSNIFTQPFQVISTNMMVSYKKGIPISMMTAIKLILKNDGFSGLYRGFVPAAIKTTVGSSIYFASLETTKTIFKEKLKLNNPMLRHFLSSGISRGIQMICVAPISLIKTRFEVSGFNSYSNTLDAIKKIKRNEGTIAYFKGLKTTLIKEMPSSASFYTLFEFFKNKLFLIGIKNTQLNSSLSGILSSGIITMVTNPLEVIRTRIQFYFFSKNQSHNYKGITSGVWSIATKEGINGLTAGMLPIFLKKGINSIIVWTLYDTLKKKI